MTRFPRMIRPALIGVALLAAWSSAQAGPRRHAEEMRAALEQVMIVRMKQVLELTPAQEKTVVPRVEKLLQTRREFGEERRSALSHLRALVGDQTADDADIEAALHEVDSIERRFEDRQRGLQESIRSELNPRQQARLYFFEQHFRQKMRDRLRDAAGGGRPGPGPRPGMGDRPRRGPEGPPETDLEEGP